jgi:hypothetical protein
VVRTWVAVLVLIFAAGCASAESPCANEPEGRIVAFFAGGEPSRDVVATVVDVASSEGVHRYRLRAGEPDLILTYRAPEPIPGVTAGGSYRFQVDYSMGSPDASGIIVSHEDRLIFAAVSDQKMGQHVLAEGIPGFEIEALPPACPSRGRTDCHESLINVPMRVRHAGSSVTLHHGEASPLGDFVVRVLTAQEVTYASRCADAGLTGISLSISRRR